MRMIKKLILLLAVLALIGAAHSAALASGTAQVTGFAWLEKTVDGRYSNESTFAGVEVTLEQVMDDGSSVRLASVTTDKDGQYTFGGLAAGNYRLRYQLPKDYLFTIPHIDSDALPAQGNLSSTVVFAVGEGKSVQKNVGATKTTSYVAFVAFEDTDTNGGRRTSEPAIRNAEITLIYEYEGEQYPIATATTDKDGEASIRSLTAATYIAQVSLPGSYVFGPMGLKINTFYNCVYATDGDFGFTAPFTIEPKGSVGIGIGAVKTGSLTGSIWFDQNYNGVWDSEETGYQDARIILYSQDLDLTRETVAAADGTYSFNRIQPGNYILTVELPNDAMFTLGNKALFAGEAGLKQSHYTSVQIDGVTRINQIGVMPTTSLAVMLYRDDNLNGQMDAGEMPYVGATVVATQNNKQVGSAVSDGQGLAFLPTLRGGEVVLTCTLQEGDVFTLSGEGNVFATPGAQQSATYTVLVQDTENATVYAGVTQPASISGFVFESARNEGAYQAGDTAVAGFVVEAVNADGNVAATAITDENGYYELSMLLPAEHTVRFLLEDPYVASPQADELSGHNTAIVAQSSAYGETETIALLPGQHVADVDAAVFRAGTVQGYVLHNGQYDSLATNEGGVAGVQVTLLDEYDAPYSGYTNAVTDENGFFYIKGILPGTYSVVYSVRSDAAFAMPYTDETTLQSETFPITTGAEITLDAIGAVRTASLRGHVTETGSTRGLDADIVLTSRTFGTVYETRTADNGEYALEGMRPDVYDLQVTLPEGYVVDDTSGAPVPTSISNISSAVLTLGSDEHLTSANIGGAIPAALTGTLYYDANLSGTMDADEQPIVGKAIHLMRGGNTVATLSTDAQGTFSAEALLPGEYQLLLALEADHILPDADAVQEGDVWSISLQLGSGEHNYGYTLGVMRYARVGGAVWSMDGTYNKVNGLSITLSDALGNQVSATTDNEGAFLFENLYPGTYTLSTKLPSGYQFARAQDATQRKSLIQGHNTVSESFVVTMGQQMLDADIGMGAMGSIGDTAWLDENGNGLQDIGEPPMPGILIELYQYGELVATTTTDAYGHYSLTDLYPGTYTMKVTMHSELKATKQVPDFPLVNSIMPESNDTVVSVDDVVVPSGGRNLNYDLGFVLRNSGKYPEAMKQTPVMDWTPYSDK